MTEVPAPGGSGGRGWKVTRNVLRGVFAAALVVLVVLIVLRFTGQGGSVLAGGPTSGPSSTPTTTPTSTGTPTPSSTPTPLPTNTVPSGGGGGTGGGSGGGGGGTTDTAPEFTDFSYTTEVTCPAPPAPDVPFTGDPSLNYIPIHLDWRSTGAVEAWVGADTADAQLAPYSQVDPNGSFDIDFNCPDDEIGWTVTLVGEDGTKTSKTARVVNTGYTG
jgi:hypothetical protein